MPGSRECFLVGQLITFLCHSYITVKKICNSSLWRVPMLFMALAHTHSGKIQGRITCTGWQVCRERRAYALTMGDTWLPLINCKASSKFAGAQCLSSMRQASSFVVATSSSAIFGLFRSLQLSILSTSSFPTTSFIARAVGTLFTEQHCSQLPK